MRRVFATRSQKELVIPNHLATIPPPPCRTPLAPLWAAAYSLRRTPLAPLWAAAYSLHRSLVVAATCLGVQLDGLGSAALPTTDLEQLQREVSGLSVRAAGAIELVKCGLAMLERAAVEATVEAVSCSAAFQLVSADVLGLDAGPLLACLLLRVGLWEQADDMAQLFASLMAEFAKVGYQFAVAEQPRPDAAAGIRAAYIAVAHCVGASWIGAGTTWRWLSRGAAAVHWRCRWQPTAWLTA